MRKSERFWDRSARRYQDSVDSNDQVAIATLDCTWTYLHQHATVLDFGCATGRYSLEVAPRVREVWGVDISSEMIKAAQRNAVANDVFNVRFLYADISDPRLNDAGFDIILAYNILHLVGDAVQTIAKLEDLLQPGGILLSVTPCLGMRGSLLEALINCGSRIGIVPQVHAFKPDEIGKLITGTKFEILESRIFEDQLPFVFIAAKKSV